MRLRAFILAMLICALSFAGQLQLPDGRRVVIGSGSMIVANQPSSFHFTVTADQRGFHTGFSNVLNGIKSVARGAGVFHITTGDFDDTPEQNRDMVDAVLGQNFVWFTPVGNHETETPTEMTWVRDEYNNGNGVRTPLKNFTLQNGPTGSVETTFSWDVGNAHFIQLNEYWNGNTNAGSDVGLGTDANIVSNMLVWLTADLMTNTKPVKIVFGHEGAYLPPGWRHAGDSLDQYPVQRDAFWSLLASNNVQAYINGNSHLYYKLYTNGVYDLDAGNAGNDTDNDGYTFFDIIIGASTVQYDIWRDTAKNGNWVKSADSFILPVVP